MERKEYGAIVSRPIQHDGGLAHHDRVSVCRIGKSLKCDREWVVGSVVMKNFSALVLDFGDARSSWQSVTRNTLKSDRMRTRTFGNTPYKPILAANSGCHLVKNSEVWDCPWVALRN
jgi:hypothetical protein